MMTKYSNSKTSKVVQAGSDTAISILSPIKSSTGTYGSVSYEQLSSEASTSSSSSSFLRKRRPSPPRIIAKSGVCQLHSENIEHQGWKYFEDLFTSLLELRWRYTLLVFCFAYFTSWTFFALAWYSLFYLHGDLANFGSPDYTPCVSGIPNFATSFLYSVETQQTIGYGFYHISDKCPDATILLCFQSIFGVLLEGLLVGLVFVKMSRAKKRSATLMFSKNAVVSQRDGQFYLMVRVGDLRTKSHLLDARVRAQFVAKRTTQEGEVIEYNQIELEIGGDGEKDNKVLLFWPQVLVHKIDSKSPLYPIAPADLTTSNNDDFEIIVILEGVVENTGLSTQARSSYLPSEILWGHRFASLNSSKSNKDGIKVIDYSLFHKTVAVKTPSLSAEETYALELKK